MTIRPPWMVDCLNCRTGRTWRGWRTGCTSTRLECGTWSSWLGWASTMTGCRWKRRCSSRRCYRLPESARWPPGGVSVRGSRVGSSVFRVATKVPVFIKKIPSIVLMFSLFVLRFLNSKDVLHSHSVGTCSSVWNTKESGGVKPPIHQSDPLKDSKFKRVWCLFTNVQKVKVI